MNETNPLKEKIESTLITRTFHVSGMPEQVFKEVDSFCRENYGDNRWTMIQDLLRFVKDDYKYNLLYDEVQTLKEDMVLLQNKELIVEEPEPVKKKLGTFGGN